MAQTTRRNQETDGGRRNRSLRLQQVKLKETLSSYHVLCVVMKNMEVNCKTFRKASLSEKKAQVKRLIM